MKLYVLMNEDKLVVCDRRENSISQEPHIFDFKYINDIPMGRDTELMISPGGKAVRIKISRLQELMNNGVKVMIIPEYNTCLFRAQMRVTKSSIVLEAVKGYKWEDATCRAMVSIIEDKRLCNVAEHLVEHLINRIQYGSDIDRHTKFILGIGTNEGFKMDAYAGSKYRKQFRGMEKEIHTDNMINTFNVANAMLKRGETVVEVREGVVVTAKQR